MQRSPRLGRHGFTLMELLMVLGLLVVMAAFSWPILRGPMENSRLRDAAAQVRNELARTRLAAMQSGRDQVLCFMPGGDRYCVAALETEVNAATCACETEGAGAETALYQEPSEVTDGLLVEPAALSLQLPQGVTFAALDEAAFALERGAVSARAETGRSRDEGERIAFHPDGTCSDATIRLANAHGYVVSIEVRGLTAVATVGPLERAPETP